MDAGDVSSFFSAFGPKMRARRAVSVAFLVNGAFFACLACRIPDIQRSLGLDEAQLGFAFLSCSLGAFFGVALAGRICARNGSHRVTVLSGIGASIALSLLSLVPNLWSFIIVFVAFGACTATMDVAMNTNGVAVEKQLPKPIMSSLHGMFSLGGLTFAGVGWCVLKAGVSVPIHFMGASALFAATLMITGPHYLESAPDPEHIAPAFVMPDRAVLIVGIIGFCAFLSEGAMGDWSAIYMRKELHQSAAGSTIGYLAFTLSMTLTRFGGDAVLHRWGASATLRLCGLVTAIGMAVALIVGSPWLTVVGFASVGFGMAIVAPIAFSLGGRLGGEKPDHAIASIATMSYTAFLVGPALIGFLAKSCSLRDALALIVLLALVIVFLSGYAERH